MAGAWLERFLEAIQAERDAARNTSLSYARDLTDFAGVPRRRAASTTPPPAAPTSRPTSSTRPTAAWRRRPARGGSRRSASSTASPSSKAGARTIPAALIKGPKRQPHPARHASARPRSTGCSTPPRAPRRTEAERLRDTCLMQLLYATGLRVSELVSLPLAAARGDPRMILVRGKGGRERMVPLSPPARDGARRLARPPRRATATARRARARPSSSRRAAAAGT